MSGLGLDEVLVGRGAFRAGPFSLHAPPGSLVALVGPNGGGKTSLLRALAGLDAARGGTVSRPPGQPALLPPPGSVEAGFGAEHLVALGRSAGAGLRASLPAADRQAARAALARLGIEELGPVPFDRLSSGQQQLVLLARLQVQNAALCLADEPTATLDPGQAAKVGAALRALADKGRVVVIATHDVASARAADLVLTVGPVVRFGPPDLLTGELLSELYGVAVALCPCCGQPDQMPAYHS